MNVTQSHSPQFKTSRGHWAKFFLAFSPVRHEAGIPGSALYKEWMDKFCAKLIPKYVDSKTYENLFASHVHLGDMVQL